jgi:hypothetical protein
MVLKRLFRNKIFAALHGRNAKVNCPCWNAYQKDQFHFARRQLGARLA